MKRFATAALVTLAFSAPSAFANKDATKYERILAETRINIVKAVQNAETHQGGTAVKAELETQLGKPVFEVDVLNAGRLFEVHVDAKTGDVLSSVEDLD